MKPVVRNLDYYQADDYTIIVSPKASDGTPIQFDPDEDSAYFRIANVRGEAGSLHVKATATLQEKTPGAGDWCIVCYIDGDDGRGIANGYVYDIGYIKNNHRVTVLTGNMSVVLEVEDYPETVLP